MSGNGGRGPGMTRTAFELKRALQRSPQVCPACTFVDDGLKNHIDALFYERAVDVATRQTIREARGFCRFHARLVSSYADALGTALIMQDVLINDLRDMQGGKYARPPAKPKALDRFFAAGKGPAPLPPCPLCEVERDIETLAADSVLEALTDGEFVTAFRQSDGLCVPHFRRVFERCRDEAIWQIVLEREQTVLGRITRELEELVEKYDYRSHEKPHGAAAEIWRRALNLTSRAIGD